MNKVVSIEIAGQVFWIDEAAYEVLKSYLLKIQQQLLEDECAKEIYKDIELRIAELLYLLSSDEKKAITIDQLDQVIEQVGFIDHEELEEDAKKEVEIIPKRSYRDPKNKILGGVCAGLAIRLGVPAFILRVVFVALSMLFGLGIALYLIFWISLDSNTSRNSALAAEGKAQTAKLIASAKKTSVNPFIQIQRVIFLPVSIVGALFTIFGEHFKRRKNIYLALIKNVFAIALIFIAFISTLLLFEFNSQLMFSAPVSWVLSAAAMYLVVLGLAVYLREYYFSKPAIKVDKRLKRGALIPVAMYILAFGFLHYSHSERESEEVEKIFAIKSHYLNLQFDEQNGLEGFKEPVHYHVRTNDSKEGEVKLYISYWSSGNSPKDAAENIQMIDYFYTFSDDTLALNKFLTLKEGALNRGQYIDVTVEVPQNILVTSNWALDIEKDNHTYQYDVRHRTPWREVSETNVYRAIGSFLHEVDSDSRNRISVNERSVLIEKFCNEYFISESWGCDSNVRYSVTDNHRFDRAFEKDSQSIDKIREYLQNDRSLFVSNLSEINDLVNQLSINLPVKSQFQEYVEHLIKVKSSLELVANIPIQ